MNDLCRRLRKRIGEDGPQSLLDDRQAEEHLASCSGCFAFLEELNQLDQVLENLPRIDAAEPLVEGVLASIQTRDEGAVSRAGLVPLALVVSSIAATLLALWGLRHQPSTQERTSSAATDTAMTRPVEPDPSPTRVPTAPRQIERASLVASATLPSGEMELIELPPEPTFASHAPPPPSPPASAPAPAEENVMPSVNAVRSAEPTLGYVGGAIRGVQGGVQGGETRATYGGLSIRVLDTDGLALPGATITFGDAATSIPTTTTITNEAGEATFPVLAPRESYWVEVSFPGFSVQRHEDLSVRAGSHESIKVAMFPEMQERVKVVAERDVIDLEKTEISTTFSNEFLSDLPVAGRSYTNVMSMAPGVQDRDGDGNPNVHGSRDRDFSVPVKGVRNVDPMTGQRMSERAPNSIEEMEVITAGAGVNFGRAQGGSASDKRATDRARAFLEERASLDGLTFRPASGYWANTYLPGDPVLRLLGMRLGSTASQTTLPVERLHGAARRPVLPFDPPRDAALGLYVAADRNNLNEPTRMLLQVGIQGTPVRGSRRPPMNVSVVLDLRGELSQETAASMRALVDALRRGRDPGDRFGLYVAGRPGGRIAGSEELRYGFLSVALNSLLAGSEPLEGPTLDLLGALEAARDEVEATDDPARPVGSSAVLLITSQQLGSSARAIEKLASDGAIKGVSLSVIAVGAGVEPAQLEALALAGQGSLRVVAAPAEAADVMARELGAVSRVVARAVRVSIRLANGVRLVDVLGSDWLDRRETERVLLTQGSIDRRTSQSLGITRDRDRAHEDDGIQILIPNFHAGDSHVVLLDVVADGPGPVAEVQIRFKDLVELKNGMARVSLDLGRGEREPGPLERDVLKNLLVLELASCLERAGTSAHAGRKDEARAMLDDLTLLLTGMRKELPDLAADPDLGADLAMLDAYAEALSQAGPTQLAWLGDSLRYAARLEVLPTSRAN